MNPVSNNERIPSRYTRKRTPPSGDLIGDRAQYNRICVPLYNATMKSDWEAAYDLIKEGGRNPNNMREWKWLGCAITENDDTVLHIAASAERSDRMESFVKNLVLQMTTRQLKLQNKKDNTALCLAAISGNVNIATHMLDRENALDQDRDLDLDLLNIRGNRGRTPLYLACVYGKSEIARDLYDKSNKMAELSAQIRGWIFEICVEFDLFDLAFTMFTEIPALGDNGHRLGTYKTVLGILAGKTDAFGREEQSQTVAAQVTSPAMKLLKEIWRIILTLDKAEVEDIIRGPAERPTDKEKQDIVQLLGTISKNIAMLPVQLSDCLKLGSVLTTEPGVTTMKQGGPSGKQDVMTTGQGDPSGKQGVTTKEQGGPSMGQGVTTTGEGDPSGKQGRTTKEQGGPSMRQGVTTTGEGDPSGKQGRTTKEQGGPSMGQDVTTTGEGDPSGKQGRTTKEQGGPSVGQGVTTTEQLVRQEQHAPEGRPEDRPVVVLQNKYPKRVLFVAAEMGNTEFVVELISQYPDLIGMTNDDNQSIFHVAVAHRQVGVYNLLHEMALLGGYLTPLADTGGNNMLHLAAAKSANNKHVQEVPGAAWQLREELSWFKEVEAMVPAPYRKRKNKDGLTPYELFTKEHKELLSAAETWMKVTAGQSLVVAALIATVVFPAAITVPGGYNEVGVPLFRHNASFIVFVISDAISLALAVISTLIFLFILTSHYRDQDFFDLLPKRLTVGLTTLFLSITTMLVAFCSSFFIHYQHRFIWLPFLIVGAAFLADLSYLDLLFGPLRYGYRSTFGSKNRFNKKEFKLYHRVNDDEVHIMDSAGP